MESTYDKKKIGDRLRSVLEEKGISQATVASWFGITQTSVSQWCRGVTEFSITTAAELARRLGVSLDWLAGLSDERKDVPTAGEQAVLELLSIIKEHGVERVVEKARGINQPPAGMKIGAVSQRAIDPIDPEDGGATPNPEDMNNFLEVMRRGSEVEERIKAAEMKIEKRGRPRNTVGEKKRKAQ